MLGFRHRKLGQGPSSSMASGIDFWLHKLGLEKYAPVFAEQEIDETVLVDLTEADLDQLGLPLGPRKKILKAIQIGDIPSTEAGPESDMVVEVPEAERRQLTVMFCDLVGSTEMSQNIDPESLRHINRSYQISCTSAVEHYGGYVARYMGDGVLAYFGYPQAHEDDAERAIRAGLSIIDKIKSLGSDDLEQTKADLEVRVGIATGPVVVGDLIGEGAAQEKAVVGETPNLAARLQGLASPGEVVVSLDTQQLVGGSVSFESMGRNNLKGFAQPVESWRVVGTDAGGGRFERSIPKGLGRFIGRTAELERLQKDLELAKSGQNVVSHIIGEPGIGKSRLLYEFFSEIGESTALLEAHCASHGHASVLLPFIDLLSRSFSLNQKQDIESIKTRLNDNLKMLDIDTNIHLPYLLNLFGINVPIISETDPGLVGLRTRDAIVSVILAHSKLMPTIVFVNDCHWIDGSSEALLDSLVQCDPGNGILTICTFRPEYEPKWGTENPPNSIELSPFSLSEAKLLFTDRFGSEQISEELFSDLYERSGGNPFFAEELTFHLQDQNQDLSAGKDLPQPGLVPKTLEGLLLQRVDKLSPRTRRFLQAASVMGRSFNDDLVAKLCGLSKSDEVLEELLGQDLVFPDRAIQSHRYQFKHALLHDAVYSSLLNSDRNALHHAIADSLASKYRERESEIAEELARHYAIAKDVSLASRWSALAGEKALGLFAHKEAVSWFNQTLNLLLTDSDSDQILFGRTLANQMEAHCWEIDYPGMTVLAEEHQPRVEAAGDAQNMSLVFTWLSDAYINTGRFADALNASEKALELAEKLKDEACTGYAKGMHLWIHSLTAEVGEADYVERESVQVLEIANNLDDLYLKTLTYYSLALDYIQRGYLANAIDWTKQSVELGRETDYSPASVWGLCLRAYANTCNERYETAEIDAREAVQLAQSNYDHLMAMMTLGSVLIVSNRAAQGMEILRDIENERKRKGLSQISFMYWPDIVYGSGLIFLDQFDSGVDYLNSTFQRFLELGNSRAAGLAALTLGEAHLRGQPGKASPSEATRYFGEALRLGKDTAMNGLAAQALLGLAALPATPEDTEHFLTDAQSLITPLGSSVLEQRLSEVANR